MLTLVVKLVVLSVLFKTANNAFHYYYGIREAKPPSENVIVNTLLVLLFVGLLATVLAIKHYGT